MEDIDMLDKVEALLQNTLAHVTQAGCSKETRRRMKQRLHRRLDLLVKGNRDEYDRHLERFHVMLEQAKGQLGPSRRVLVRQALAQELRHRYDDFLPDCHGYVYDVPNYAFAPNTLNTSFMRPGLPYEYPNYFEPDYGQDPVLGWQPWSDAYRGPSGAWEYPGAGCGGLHYTRQTALIRETAPVRRRSSSLPRTRLRPPRYEAQEFNPMTSEFHPMAREFHPMSSISYTRSDAYQICEAARLAATEPSLSRLALPAVEVEPVPETPKFERAADWLDAGLKQGEGSEATNDSTSLVYM